MASLVLSKRLTVHKQSFLDLLKQNGHAVKKVYWQQQKVGMASK